jgi:hypothetical protein
MDGGGCGGSSARGGDNPYELPSVDDLEVAALAAASGMQAMQELQQVDSSESEVRDTPSLPGWALAGGCVCGTHRSLRGSQRAQDDSSSSDDDASSSEAGDVDGAVAAPKQVAVQLTAGGSGGVSLVLQLCADQPRGGDVTMAAADSSSSDDSSSSSSEDSDVEIVEAGGSDEEGAGAPMDYAEMRDMIDNAYR